VGFTDELLRKGVAALSGGWKMKLALARAMLQKADILLLDEPTNHLDVHNVAWVKVGRFAGKWLMEAVSDCACRDEETSTC